MSNEESAARLEMLRSASPKMFDAAIKAIEAKRVDATKFDVSPKRAVEHLSGKASGLESFEGPLGSMMGLEAIVRRVGRPPLLVLQNVVQLEPLDDFPAQTDEKIRAVQDITASVGRVEFINAAQAWGGTGRRRQGWGASCSHQSPCREGRKDYSERARKPELRGTAWWRMQS
jgi:endonuclease G, mitochondrial